MPTRAEANHRQKRPLLTSWQELPGNQQEGPSFFTPRSPRAPPQQRRVLADMLPVATPDSVPPLAEKPGFMGQWMGGADLFSGWVGGGSRPSQ